MNIFALVADELCNFPSPKRNKTILPTGKYKVVELIVLFEADVIVHRPHENIGVGMGMEWIAVPQRYKSLV
jgi:hypothetical protein